MKILKLVWFYFEKIGLFMGNLISGAIMTVFYFTIFAVFAIPFNILSSGLDLKPKKSNWKIRKLNNFSLDDFKSE